MPNINQISQDGRAIDSHVRLHGYALARLQRRLPINILIALDIPVILDFAIIELDNAAS